MRRNSVPSVRPFLAPNDSCLQNFPARSKDKTPFSYTNHPASIKIGLLGQTCWNAYTTPHFQYYVAFYFSLSFCFREHSFRCACVTRDNGKQRGGNATKWRTVAFEIHLHIRKKLLASEYWKISTSVEHTLGKRIQNYYIVSIEISMDSQRFNSLGAMPD